MDKLTHLRPYQEEIGKAIWASVLNNSGLTITVEIARQGGKNELSARMELLLLNWYSDEAKNLIKCSPTFKPQTVISMTRLKEALNAAGFAGEWESEMGYIIKFRNAKAIFLSAEEKASVVGNTAHLLLEVDEAQDVSEDKYTKEFKPMGSTTNVTNVLYGTTWDDSTLLEKMKQINLEKERKDGIRRHFRYDWQEVAKYNAAYLEYVEGERARLGENHPLFMTQYRLMPVRGGGRFLNELQRAQLQGSHQRQRNPEPGKIYIAGIDLAGEAESGEDDYLKALQTRQDSTVISIAELMPSAILAPYPQTPDFRLHGLRLLEHYVWTGINHAVLYPQIVDILKNVWHCRKVVVDATGLGQPVASFLTAALGSRVSPFPFSTQAKSELGFNLLAAINSGALKMYAADNSAEYQEFWHQMEKAKGYYRASQTMKFFVDPAEGHDDYLMSLALLVEAGRQYQPREARGK